MKKIVKSFRLVAILVLFLGLFSQSCFAEDYSVTSEATLDSSLIDASATDKTLNINSDVTLTDNLSTPSGTTISVEGNGNTLDGGSKTGFLVASGQTLNINNYSIQNFFYNYGGAIYNYTGTLTINHSTFDSNSASSGGAILNDAGTLTINNSTFKSNSAYKGGAIYNAGTLTIAESIFTGNTASINEF
jgi:predicted outer membrane repeat protein